MHGPIYCETGHPWLGIAEPVNFITNLFAILAAFLATRLVMRSPQRHDVGLWLLVLLLYAVGIGSALWHGMRTMLTLALDTAPGLLFLLVLVGLWMGRLYGRLAGVLAPVALITACFATVASVHHLAGPLSGIASPLRFASAFLPVIVLAIGLIVATARRNPQAARAGTFALAAALIAATARSVDLMVCPFTPFGSHFLWHGFLSLAAYLAIVTMLRLKAPA